MNSPTRCLCTLCLLDVPVDVAGDAAAGHGAVPELEVITLRAVVVRRARRPEQHIIILIFLGILQFCYFFGFYRATSQGFQVAECNCQYGSDVIVLYAYQTQTLIYH